MTLKREPRKMARAAALRSQEGPYLRYIRRHRATRHRVVFNMLQKIFLSN
jgi:hypothetical protein